MDEERKAALLQQISEKRNGSGNREAGSLIQDKFRSLDRALDEISGTASSALGEGREGIDEPSGNAGSSGNSDSRFSWGNGSSDESNGGANQDSAGIERADTTTQPVEGTDKKPGGLNIVPSKREKKVRDEEARKRANAEKQRAFRARKKAAKEGGLLSVPSLPSAQPEQPAKRSLLDALPLGKEKAEKAVRKAFTEVEAKAVKPLLVSAMLDYFQYADELLYATVKGHPRVEIWSTIDAEECGILADALVARGKKSAAGAAQIQAMVDVHKNLKVGLILAPRFYQTFRLYMDSGGASLK